MKATFLLAIALLAGGCAQDIQNSGAVRQAVLDHLKSRSDFGLNLDAMDIQVSSVKFRENEADATVAFVPKGHPGASGMSMNYTLNREGGKWVVKTKSMAGIQGGGAPAEGSPSSELPPGHVAVPPAQGK